MQSQPCFYQTLKTWIFSEYLLLSQALRVKQKFPDFLDGRSTGHNNARKQLKLFQLSRCNSGTTFYTSAVWQHSATMEMEPLVKWLGTWIVPQKVYYARYFTCPEEVETTYV